MHHMSILTHDWGKNNDVDNWILQLIEVTKWGMLSFILTLVAMSNMWNEKKEG